MFDGDHHETPILALPDRPADGLDLAGRAIAWREDVQIETYEPDAPDRFPAFLENRVYQGSSGRVYPLPFHERIDPARRARRWDAIHLENEYVRLMVLPDLGGRIHFGLDKTNGYDFFYRNNVIKPALVGLAGPWVSGGVEFNWPQHHRPATYLPTSAFVENEPDGSVTVWCSDHDPFARMKGMHGIRLRPDSSVIEARVRLFNRTEDVQTFLWWANVAAAVNDDYQSFFPTDVHVVADHAKRDVTAFPAADRPYYGIDYPARVDADHPDADRIDWYRNIPVPTSYMCVGTADDFFGGYDHGREAGFVHVADHHLAPGKKQWTWGDDPFGHAWDRNLTESDGPYVELMAGVYTDNQPDFTFLAPGETKAFSQYWYPIKAIGPAQQATLDCAVSLVVDGDRARLGVATPREHADLPVTLRRADDPSLVLWATTVTIGPADPYTIEFDLPAGSSPTDVELVVGRSAAPLLTWRARPAPSGDPAAGAEPATEPPPPEGIASVDELYVTGLHLDQYRHATRSPEPYWQRVLDADPLDSRCNVAMASRRSRAADHAAAERHLRAALSRLTRRNPNPYDGEASYRLGVVLTHLGRDAEAYDALSKALWNAAWRAPGHAALARLDARAGRWGAALDHAEAALRVEGEHLQAMAVRTVALRALGREEEATAQVVSARALDPLDAWTADLAGADLPADGQIVLDVALEWASLGRTDDALRVLDVAASLAPTRGDANHLPLVEYHRADLLAARAGTWDDEGVRAALARAGSVDATHCLAGRVADVDAITRVVAHAPDDARAHGILGHWLYFHRRYAEAIASWRASVSADPTDAVIWRCLGIGAYNVDRDVPEALGCYATARDLAPRDPKLLYEADQLARRTGVDPAERLAVLEPHAAVVGERDDLVAEYAELLQLAGRTTESLDVVARREFHPWEGGEGRVLGVWDGAHLAIARDLLRGGDAPGALAAVEAALDPPANLGEGRHPLANRAELMLVLGEARAAAGDEEGARAAWRVAAAQVGDFQTMTTVPYSENTYFSVVAARRLGDDETARALTDGLAGFRERLLATVPTVDYFATSLPAMLLFRADLDRDRDVRCWIIAAQLARIAGDDAEAGKALAEALRLDPSHALAGRLVLDWGATVGHG